MFKKIQNRRDEKLRREFLPEALEIIEKPASPLGHTIIWLIIAVVIAFLIWSIVSRIDENATATGKIVTAMGIQTVQSEVGGTVKEIFASEGDSVKKGQPLLQLETDLSEDTLTYYQSMRDVAGLKIKLLKKLLKDQELTMPGSKEYSEEERDVLEYVKSIQSEKASELSEYDNKIAAANASVIAEESSLEILEEQLTTLERKKDNLERKIKRKTSEEEQLDVMKDKEKILEKKYKRYQSLYKEEIITKNDLEQLEMQIQELKGNISIQNRTIINKEEEIKDSIDDVESSILETKKKISVQNTMVSQKEEEVLQTKEAKKGIDTKYDTQIKSLIVEQQAQFKQVEINIDQCQKQLDSSVITSPCDGVIKTTIVNTIGAVVPQATALMEIVPENSELIMEANVNNSDIGYVKMDQEVKIKLSTFDYQEFGLLKGRVSYISKDSQMLQNGKEVYKIKVTMNAKEYLNDNPNIELKTGMEGTVEIKIGSRRVIDFFLEPLTKQFEESLTVR